MKISIIVAASINNVIGIDGRLPWHIPEDLKYFKELTLGKTIIMGRKTHESIGYALPQRVNIVVTQFNISGQNLYSAPTLKESLEIASKFNKRKFDEIFIIGGTRLFIESLPLVNTIYLTRINKEVEGDTYIPENLLHGFKLENSKLPRYDEDLECTYSFQKYIRN